MDERKILEFNLAKKKEKKPEETPGEKYPEIGKSQRWDAEACEEKLKAFEQRYLPFELGLSRGDNSRQTLRRAKEFYDEVVEFYRKEGADMDKLNSDAWDIKKKAEGTSEEILKKKYEEELRERHAELDHFSTLIRRMRAVIEGMAEIFPRVTKMKLREVYKPPVKET